jgi:hypothetical protein
MTGARIFTPRPVDFEAFQATQDLPHHEDGERILMSLSVDDAARWDRERSPYAWTRVTDAESGLLIDIREADCGAACFCAAEFRVIPG